MKYPKKIPKNEKSFYDTSTFFQHRALNLTDSILHQDYSFDMHIHDFWEINIVIAGEGCHYIENTSIPVYVGDVFVIPPGILHGYRSGKGLDVFHVLMKKEFLNRYQEELSALPGYSVLIEIEPMLRQIYDRKMFLSLDADEMTVIKREVRELEHRQKAQLGTAHDIGVLQLLCRLCMKMHEKQNMPERHRTREDAVLRIMEYINTHWNERITEATLQEISFMSASTINRHFKRILNQTPAEYMMRCRIRTARGMIAQADKTKTEIAQICGFYDVSHMNKCLRLYDDL